MKIMDDVNRAIKSLYDHVGFVEDWVLCPIDDCTEMYWDVNEHQVKYAKSKEDFESDGDYFQDSIFKQRHYSKWVYEGNNLTMVMCDPHIDGVKWFRVFNNQKRIKSSIR